MRNKLSLMGLTACQCKNRQRNCSETEVALDLILVLFTGRLCSLILPWGSRLVSPKNCRLQRLHVKVFRYSLFKRHTDVLQLP